MIFFIFLDLKNQLYEPKLHASTYNPDKIAIYTLCPDFIETVGVNKSIDEPLLSFC